MEENFSNQQIFNLEMPNFEDLEMIRVSRKYLRIVLFNLSIFSVFLIGGAGAALYFFDFDVSLLQILMIAIATLLIIIYLFLNAIIGFKFRKYAVREKDLVYQRGWLKRSIIIIPFNRIQHIKIQQGWFSKILHLKSISFFTAGVSGGDITVNGLPEEIAEGINDHIRVSISKEKTEDGGEA